MTLATAEGTATPVLRAAGTSASPPPLLEARAVSKRFGALPVLDQVSLRVDAGQVVALVGDNGAGKSTLAKCIARTIRADSGEVLMRGEPLGQSHNEALRAGVGVVWQDLALCDNLDTVANLFLGHERRRMLLPAAHLHREARAALDRLGIAVPDLQRPVATLSGGQRQAIAVARALDADPALLILDEPTASLGRHETAQVLRIVRELRDRGTAVLLITHRLEQVFDLADRIVVLRQGRVVADVTPLEVHPDDVVALQSGIEIDSTASRQLRRLGSLVEQISEAEPTASLPLVVTAMAAAIGQESLCVHLLDDAGPRPVLRRTAAVALDPALFAATETLPVGAAGGPVGLAAESSASVVSEDVRLDPAWAPLGRAAAAAGVLSSWATPIVGVTGVLGTISGYGGTVGRPRSDQLELIALYAGHAAASIERERLFADAQRRNRVLEAIRAVLEVLAGPEQVRTGLDPALAALCAALGAGAALVRVAAGGDGPATRGSVTADEVPVARVLAAADAALDHGQACALAAAGGRVHAVPFGAPGGRAALAVWWADAAQADGSGEVLHDVTRSLSLALERAELERAHQEAEALRRSQRLQRSFLSRLSHELRTPLTAIHGCVDTLRQPDVEWDAAEQDRFLGTIATESDRMRRLVADLLDASAIDAGIFRVHPDWCDLGLVLDASVACAAGADSARVSVDVAPDLGPVWADHDRLEQVFVNLVENALRHTPAGTPVRVEAGPVEQGGVEVRVSDEGPGVPPDVAATVFEPHTAGAATGGHGLGLAIARGIARAHGGAVVLDGDRRRRGASFVVTLPGTDG